MIKKLNHSYAVFFSIFAPLFNFSLCLLLDKSVSRDIEEKNDKLQIITEEIHRRQKLVQPHIINMAEKQKDWIESYPPGMMINEIPSKRKMKASGNPVLKDYPFNNAIPLKGDKRQKIEKDWPENHQLNFDGSKREIVPDIAAKSSSKAFPISPGERRHKTEEDKIANIEEGIETDYQESKDINAKTSSCSCNRIKNTISNNIKADEDISEVIILESAFPEFAKIRKDSFESYDSIRDNGKQDDSPDIKMNSASEKVSVDFDFLDNSNMEKSVESIYLNSENNKHDILSGNFKKAESVDSDDKFTPNADYSLSRHKIKDVPFVKPIEKPTKKDRAYFSNNAEKPELPHNHKWEGKDSMSEFPIIIKEIHETLNEIDNIRKSLSEAVDTEKTLRVGNMRSFPNDAEKHEDTISNYKFKINSEGTLPPLNHKTFDTSLPEFSEIDLDEIESYLTADNIQENFFHAVKELTDLKDVNRIKDSTLCEITNDETCEQTDNAKSKSKEEKNVLDQYERNNAVVSKGELPSISEEQLQKQKLVKSFVSSLDEERENWKEIHQFSQRDADSQKILKSRNNFNRDRYDSLKPGQTDEDDIFQKVYNQERLFFTRWLKKLMNKFGRFPSSGYVTVNFLFVTEIINDMKKICDQKNFDIVDADKVISSLISNAIVHSGDNLNSFYDVSASVSFYIVVSIIFLVLLYFTLLHYRIFRVVVIFLICIAWHGFKMYQEKVTEKHATVAGSSPAYCESILNEESGLYAHIKEFIRYNTYSGQCKKYYEALMIDPASELSLSIIVSDFVSSTFFQVFRPMGRALNVFVKDSFFDLGLLEAFYLCLIVVLIFFFCVACTLIYNKYKLSFPFFMGSVEPTTTPVGSGIEDLALEPSADNESANRDVSKKFNISIVYHTRDCGSSVLHQNRQHKNSVRRYSL